MNKWKRIRNNEKIAEKIRKECKVDQNRRKKQNEDKQKEERAKLE